MVMLPAPFAVAFRLLDVAIAGDSLARLRSSAIAGVTCHQSSAIARKGEKQFLTREKFQEGQGAVLPGIFDGTT